MKLLLITKGRWFLKPPTFLKFYVLFCFLALQGYSQIRIESIITNNSGEGIPYAHVRVKGTNKGTISNFRGEFSLVVSEEDTIVVSSIGFFSKKVPVEDIKIAIQLEESVTALSEIQVTADRKIVKSKTIVKGYNRKVIGLYSGPHEVALFIPNQEKILAKILNVNFELSRIRFNPSPTRKKATLKNKELLIGLNIYSAIKDHENANLITRQLTLRIKNRQRNATFNVASLNIPFPKNGVYISVKFLGVYEDDLFIPFNELSKKQKHQFAPIYSRNNSWPHTYTKYSIGEKFVLDQIRTEEGFSNANFQIELETY